MPNSELTEYLYYSPETYSGKELYCQKTMKLLSTLDVFKYLENTEELEEFFFFYRNWILHNIIESNNAA